MNTTNTSKAYQWLAKHNLTLGESFSTSLRTLCKNYQLTHDIHTLQEVYQCIGLKKEYLYYWEKHPNNTQTKKNKISCYPFCR